MDNVIEIGLLIVIIGLLVARPKLLAISTCKVPKIIIDSCGLIDGRIVDVIEAGYMSGEIIIPQFILRELQLLADGNDSQKRLRARYGLDVARKLQMAPQLVVKIDETVVAEQTTDDKLIGLAKKRRAQLYTIDYNLSKVAALEGVSVLNVNELAQRLRPAKLPGETVEIKIVGHGSNKNQGVGYMDDGTMVVVDNAAKYKDRTIEVEVERMHQTLAGRMMFGRLKNSSTKTRG